MADRNASITLSQNEPNDDKPTSPAFITTASGGEEVKIESSPTTGNGMTDDKVQELADTKDEIKTEVKIGQAQDVNTSNEGAKAGQAHDGTSNEGTSSSVKDAASINTADSRPQYKFSRPEERKAMLFITQSHAAADEASTPAFKEDKDIIKLTEMVSQMTHLLAASGMGKTTTARALAYINGPDKLDAKAAMFEAKRDRKKKNHRRVSHGNAQSSGKADVTDSTKDHTISDNKISDQDGSASDQKTTAPSAAITSTSEEHTDAVLTEASNDAQKNRGNATQKNVGDAAGAADGHNTDEADKPKKRFGRPKWNWGSRRRNENKNKREAGNLENRAAEGQEPAADATDSAKGSAVIGEEQKDQHDLAPVQVARAA